MATKTITHQGTVINVFRDTVTVAVESSEACGGCSSKSACSLGTQSGVRNILITTPEATEYSVGERVVVATQTPMGLMAVLYSYVVPAVVLVVALAVAVGVGASDGVAAVVSLVAVALYYTALWIARERISRKITFTIYKEQ